MAPSGIYLTTEQPDNLATYRRDCAGARSAPVHYAPGGIQMDRSVCFERYVILAINAMKEIQIQQKKSKMLRHY